MTATAHALVGGAIAASVNDPSIGLTLSFASHPLLDMIPHWDFGWGWRKKSKKKLFIQATLDLAIGFVVSYLLFGRSVPFFYFALCIFLAEIWDILEIPYWFLNWHFPPFSWIYRIQSSIQGKAAIPWGIISQVFSVAVLMVIFQNIKF